MNRRDFLKKSSGALVVAFSSVGSMRDVVFAQGPQAGRFDGPGTPQLDSWVAIGADGKVTAYTGKVELGHGLYTSQTQLVAEELCVPLSRVKRSCKWRRSAWASRRRSFAWTRASSAVADAPAFRTAS